MLVELKVTNFAIIDNLHISFQEGLNILSGETGAGKSVLLKSLALLMGDKAISDTVRTGADTATVEGFFDITDRPDVIEHLHGLGIDTSENSLVVRRVISAQGKSRVYMNGGLTALASLREIVSPLIEVAGQTAPLIEMTGQHENRHLQSKSYQLDVLDDYTGSWTLRKEVTLKFHRLVEIDEKLASIQEQARMRAQKLDFLIFQRDEIKSLNLVAGEENELETFVGRLKNSHKLSEFVEQAESALYSDDDSALVRIHTVLQKGAELSRVDSELDKKLESLAQAKALIEDSVYELRDYGKQLDADPSELNRSEAKLSQLRKLQKKYGGTVDEILATLKKIESEIDELENSDVHLKQLHQERDALSTELSKLAGKLHKRRVTGAELLSKGINDELIDLNMKGLHFSIRLDQLDEVSSTGITDIEYLVQPSKKDSARSLAKVASGGELSRILLAIKRIVGSSDQPRTYLFDEVDTGVSGPTAEKVGRKLKSIAKGQQVICVTHLPQVAAFADCHFLIEKTPTKNGVQMRVRQLNSDLRVQEIARLISGEKITKTSLEHAKELLAVNP